MSAPRYPLWLANKPEEPNFDLKVLDKYTGDGVAEVPLADAATIDRAIAAAVEAREPMAAMPPYQRRDVLEHCVVRFTERQEELATALCAEAGKPIRDARGEVTRLIDTFRVAAGEATRITGEVLPMEISERARGYRGMWKRVPVGPCSFISPFNFPLNLVAHKVAPAIAAGCPFVLKPASLTPIGALMIGEVLAEADLPPGAFSILPCTREGAAAFTEDERFALLSFTGSPDVGWDLKARAGRKKVVLELGGNAACVVDSDADLDDAIPRIVNGAFYQSGQSCISVQRVIIHTDVYDAVRERLVEAVGEIRSGDPRDPEVLVGPIISEREAERIAEWVAAGVAAGGRVLVGGGRSGTIVEPTLLENVPVDQPVVAREVFGPVAVLSRAANFEAALDQVNASPYGLQAGVFTGSLSHALRAWDRLEVGGVLINDSPSWRVDHMPYGGVKESGLGREGVRFAIEDMTEIRLLAIREGRSRT